jgi:hypothetical protein
MALSEAMNLAVRLLQNPTMVRRVRRQPLPQELTNLLEIAIGKETALEEAATATALSPERLQDAAGFFIEQILLHHRADSYRVLGVAPDAERAEIARHLRLIMKWLHPDVIHSGSGRAVTCEATIDRSVFVSRVTGAWENLKTEARRRGYDEQRGEKRGKTISPAQRQRPRASGPRPPWRIQHGARAQPHHQQPVRYLLAAPNSHVSPGKKTSRLTRIFRALMRPR